MRLGRKIALVLCALSPALVGVACSNSSSTGGPDDAGTDGLGSDATPTGDDGGDATMGTTGDSGPDGVSGTDADAGPADAPHEGSSSADADAAATQDAAEASVATDADAGPTDSPVDVSSVVPDGAADAEAGAFDGGCVPLTNSAPIVVTSTGSGSPPAAIGGTIPSGTYYVTSEVLYPSIDAGSNGPGLQTTKQTVVISGTGVNVVLATGTISDGGVGAPQYLAETLSPSGTSLVITVTCGGGDGGWNGGTFPYSVNTSDGGPTTISVLIANTLITLTKQ